MQTLTTNGEMKGKITLSNSTVIGITQPPLKEGAWSSLLHNDLSLACRCFTNKGFQVPFFWRRLHDHDYCALFQPAIL